ncbi:hypothetical protein D3C72_1075820 [compost metagenome]
MKGPEPTTSVRGAVVGILARRSGRITGGKPEGLASASSTMPKGSLSVSVNVRASTAFHSAPASPMARPRLSRAPQRCSEAIASAEVTALPSENFRPGRSVKLHCRPSFELLYFSTICGCGLPVASCANSVS